MIERLLELDRDWSSFARVAERPGLRRTFAALLAHSGDSWFWLLGLSVLWLFGDAEWKDRALLMGAAVVITAVIVMAIKFSVRRKRPEGDWGRIYRHTDPHSFPSGHAARAFMLAVLALGAGPAWFGALLAVWAPLVALARVSMGVHYLSDVVAGAALGAGLGAIYLVLLA